MIIIKPNTRLTNILVVDNNESNEGVRAMMYYNKNTKPQSFW
jgi:hypothetical protein